MYDTEPPVAPLPSELAKRVRELHRENVEKAKAHGCSRCGWHTVCLCADRPVAIPESDTLEVAVR